MSEPPKSSSSDGTKDRSRDNSRDDSRDDAKFIRYLRTFLVPTFILKTAILYCGIHYASYPGEGYGWGLIFSILLSLCNFGLFIYKNWEEEEDPSR